LGSALELLASEIPVDILHIHHQLVTTSIGQPFSGHHFAQNLFPQQKQFIKAMLGMRKVGLSKYSVIGEKNYYVK
jgi:hypothetical protein